MIKRILNRFRGKKKYVKFKNPTKTSVALSYIDGFLDGVTSEREKIALVQIGAHDGSAFDPINVFVDSNRGRVDAGFVEPQPEVFELLKENKSSIPNARFLNALIVNGEKSIPLYRLKKEYWGFYKPDKGLPDHAWPTAIASSDYEHVRARVERYLSKDSGVKNVSDVIEKLEIPCMPLTEAIRTLGFERVDFLQVDAEGFDDKVIMSLDLNEFRPSAISYEYAHVSGGDYKEFVSFLMAQGYEIKRWSGTDEIAIDRKRDAAH